MWGEVGARLRDLHVMLNTGDAAYNAQDDTSQPGMWRPLKATMTTATTIAICECALPKSQKTMDQ